MNGKYTKVKSNDSRIKYESSFSDDMDMSEYRDFTDVVLSHLLRISPIVFYNIQMVTGNKVALFEIIGKYAKELKEIIIWDKINSEPAIQHGVMNSQFEFILVFDKNNAISRKFINSKFKRGTLSNLWKIPKNKNTISSHKAGMPLDVANTAIANFTDVNDVVLDPFMGLGTTGVSAIKHKRNFIGIELDKEYFNVAKTNLELELKQKKLF
jgi:DNA modification methylase